VKLSVTSSGSDVTNATRECDRRLTGSVSAPALGYFEPATSRSDVIWYSDESSTSSSRDVTSSSSAAPRHHTGDVSPEFPDDQRNQRLHRSSPLTALNSIYVDHVTSCAGGGVVNAGFVGDGVLTDSWRRVSWRARLRAGIARSTVSSDPGPAPATSRAGDTAACTRQPSYLSDVIDSVTFFSNAGQAGAQARREFPLTDVAASVARCQSDGGEWTLQRDRDRDRDRGHRPSSLQVSRGPRHTDRTPRDTYYTYVKPDGAAI